MVPRNPQTVAGIAAQAREAFSAPRFKALYRIWKQDGDRALAELGSAALYVAVTAEAGRLETLEFGHPVRSPHTRVNGV
jgi:hypothetical protein